MSQSTRSKGRSVRLNTLVSSSKQGNNSIASAMDSEDSNGETEDLGIISGHVAPETLQKDLPKFSEETLQYKGKYKFPYELLHVRKRKTDDKENLTSHMEVSNIDLEQNQNLITRLSPAY